MQTLRRIDERLALVPASAVTRIGRIEAGRGRAELYRRQRPALLDRLVEVARIQSAESSSAIEGVRAPARRLRELMGERTEPRNRSEAEIAGYRAALDLVHANAAHMPLTSNVVLQLHRDLYGFTALPGGVWKTTDNHVEERLPDGTSRVVLRTVPFGETAAAMDELGERARSAWAAAHHHPLLLTGAYVLDFLCVHPFLDGNGRMARLLTLLLLYHAGDDVGRYVSLERIVEGSKDGYYGALRRSSEGWHEGRHDPWPWLDYFLGVVVAAHAAFEERAGVLGGRGAKAAAIERYVLGLPPGAPFRVSDVRRVAGGASDSHVSKVLARLRDDGAIAPRGRGRSAAWERLPGPPGG